MADDVIYTSTNPAGLPDTTKQVTDEHATRGHMPVVKLAISADGDATFIPATVADGMSVKVTNTVPVTGTFFQATQPVSATTLPLPTGAATLAAQTQPGVDIGDVTINNGAGAAAVNIQDGGNSITVDGAVFAGKSATATLSNVADSATSVTLLAANANRNGATLYNDSSKACFVKFGTTASATSFTVKMLSDAYYEIPFYYTGIIDGIWAANSSGSMRITEFTT